MVYYEALFMSLCLAMYTVVPGVAKGFHLLWLASDMARVTILHVTAGGAPLEVAAELDAVGRVEVDALHLGTKACS